MILIRTLIIAFALFSLITINTYAHTYAEGQSIETVIDNAINGDHRSAGNKARDIYRHPKETLLFFGIEPDMKVLEILPGLGWYTEVLTPILKDNGELTVASFGENHPHDYLRGLHIKFAKQLDGNPELYGKIKRALFEDNGYLKNIASGSQDMVVTFRNTHNWIRFGGVEDAYRAFHRVLKKGGVLGVVQHRAHREGKTKETAQKGYVPEGYLIKLAESMGFKLIDRSEINANPKDTRDHPEGVWTLPPGYRLKDVNKEKYKAIGESDRMTLRFVKL